VDGKDRGGRDGRERERRREGPAVGGILLQGLRGDRCPCAP